MEDWTDGSLRAEFTAINGDRSISWEEKVFEMSSNARAEREQELAKRVGVSFVKNRELFQNIDDNPACFSLMLQTRFRLCDSGTLMNT